MKNRINGNLSNHSTHSSIQPLYKDTNFEDNYYDRRSILPALLLFI